MQLGDGTPALESVVAAAVAAAATGRVRIEFGVLVLAVREVVWLAAQLASRLNAGVGCCMR